MQDTLKLGRLVGVKVGANWSLFALAAIVAYFLATSRLPADAFGYANSSYWLAGALTAVALLAGVLVHEVAHAVAAQRAGLHVDGITLWFMGGVTRIDGDNRKPSTELVVALVGPLASGVIGALSLLLAWPAQNAGWGLTAASLRWLGLINLLLGVFNLLPASPLDGGRVLHGLIWSVTKNRWLATRLAAGAGMVLGVACGLLGLLAFDESDALDGVVLLVMGWFVISSSKREQLAGRAQHVLGDAQVSDIMRPAVLAPGWLTVERVLERVGEPLPGLGVPVGIVGRRHVERRRDGPAAGGGPAQHAGFCESPGRRPSVSPSGAGRPSPFGPGPTRFGSGRPGGYRVAGRRPWRHGRRHPGRRHRRHGGQGHAGPQADLGHTAPTHSSALGLRLSGLAVH